MIVILFHPTNSFKPANTHSKRKWPFFDKQQMGFRVGSENGILANREAEIGKRGKFL